MIKKIKYISISVFRSLKHDFNSGWKCMDKPNEMMNILFLVFMIQVITKRYYFIPLTVILYIAAYIWKVIKRGEWKRLMRNNYYKK